jgi:hypothetical protein
MKRLMDARRERRALLESMSADERATFEKDTIERTRHLREQITTAIKTYPDPPRLMNLARQLFL